MFILKREEAAQKLKKLIGKDLRKLADEYNVTVFKNGKLNKGWAGHVLEKYLGLGLNSLQAPNGQSWELKIVPLIKKNGLYFPKETMAITMINAKNVAETDFEQSHLLKKLESLIICGREFENKKEEHSNLINVGTFDLLDKKTKKQVKKDYKLVQNTIKEKGFNELTGAMGVLVQPRTKGPGHGSTSRAFYARTGFVEVLIGI